MKLFKNKCIDKTFNSNAFTLVEVIVSITIFSIIMISIIAIYILSSDTSAKSDVNRAMHENLKSVITEI
jgi:prepilin-type N-terminal cleavage/methylation domain-containing protein